MMRCHFSIAFLFLISLCVSLQFLDYNLPFDFTIHPDDTLVFRLNASSSLMYSKYNLPFAISATPKSSCCQDLSVSVLSIGDYLPKWHNCTASGVVGFDLRTNKYSSWTGPFDIFIQLIDHQTQDVSFGTTGLRSCEFSLLAHGNDDLKLDNYIPLENGVSLLYSSEYEAVSVQAPIVTVFFRFNKSASTGTRTKMRSVSLRLTPIFGDPIIRVSTTATQPDDCTGCPGRDSCWKSKMQSYGWVEIPVSDPKFVESGYYYVGVSTAGNPELRATESQYYLSMQVSGSILRLVEGVPFFGRVVESGEGVFFSYSWKTDPHCGSDVLIELTPLSVFDDLQLFVSVHAKKPSPHEFEWSAKRPGILSLVIPMSEVGDFPTTFYLGVYSAGNHSTDFAVVVKSWQSYTLLVKGIDHRVSEQKAGSYRFFRLFHDRDHDLRLCAVSGVGNVKIFASLNRSLPIKHDYVSHGLDFDARAAVIDDIPPDVSFGFVYVGVLVESEEDASYLIRFESEDSLRSSLLLPGKPSFGHHTKSYCPSWSYCFQYFQFSLIPGELFDHDVILDLSLDSVQGLSEEQVQLDVYVDCHLAPLTYCCHSWSFSLGSRLRIGRDELEREGCEVLQIGVMTTHSGNAKFSFLASFAKKKNNVEEVLDGEARVGSLQLGSIQYRYRSPIDGSVVISLRQMGESVVGLIDARIYVSTNHSPNEFEHGWKGESELVIPNIPENETLYVVVVPSWDPFEYEIAVQTAWKCFGVSSRNSSVCFSHGACIRTDQCACDVGWSDLDCSVPICGDSHSPCTGHGTCVAPSECVCISGWIGSNCANSLSVILGVGISVPAVGIFCVIVIVVGLCVCQRKRSGYRRIGAKDEEENVFGKKALPRNAAGMPESGDEDIFFL